MEMPEMLAQRTPEASSAEDREDDAKSVRGIMYDL
jgi:hypothetical protein